MGESDGRRFGDFLLGIQGLALLRRSLIDPKDVSARVGEITEIVRRLDHEPFSETVSAPWRKVREGYDAWSETYDDLVNPMLDAELRAIAP